MVVELKHKSGSLPPRLAPWPPHSIPSNRRYGHEGDVVPVPKEFTVLWDISTCAEIRQKAWEMVAYRMPWKLRRV